MLTLKVFVEILFNRNVKEINQLADILKEEYGIEPLRAEVLASEKKVETCEVPKLNVFFEYKKEQDAWRRKQMQKKGKNFCCVLRGNKTRR